MIKHDVEYQHANKYALMHTGTRVAVIDWFDRVTQESVWDSGSYAAKHYRKRIRSMDMSAFEDSEVVLCSLNDGRLRVLHKVELEDDRVKIIKPHAPLPNIYWNV